MYMYHVAYTDACMHAWHQLCHGENLQISPPATIDLEGMNGGCGLVKSFHPQNSATLRYMHMYIIYVRVSQTN